MAELKVDGLTVDEVADAFIQAARTARKLPPVRVQGHFNAWPTIGPRQAIACPGSARWPIDSIGTPKRVSTGTSFLSRACGLPSSLSIRRGCEGP